MFSCVIAVIAYIKQLAVTENCITSQELGKKVQQFAKDEKLKRHKKHKNGNPTYSTYVKHMEHRFIDMQERKPQRTTKSRKKANLNGNVQDMMDNFKNLLNFYNYKPGVFF